jgi:hypothetical protein
MITFDVDGGAPAVLIPALTIFITCSFSIWVRSFRGKIGA